MRWLLGLVSLFATNAIGDEFLGREYVLGNGHAGAPMVIALHGMRGPGPQVRDNANLGPMAGATIAFPTAPGGVWNDGRFDAMTGRAQRCAKQDDVGLLIGLARHLGHEQFYVIGHFNGGGMAMQLACDAEEHVLGVANVVTKMLVDYKCEDALRLPLARGHDAATSLAFWATRNRCGVAEIAETNPERTDGARVRTNTYQGCTAPLVYYEMIGAGHAFPGADDIRRPRLRALVGEQIRDVSARPAAAKVWFGE